MRPSHESICLTDSWELWAGMLAHTSGEALQGFPVIFWKELVFVSSSRLHLLVLLG
jgi:hypothetical protein